MFKRACALFPIIAVLILVAAGCSLPGWERPGRSESIEEVTPPAVSLAAVLVGSWEVWSDAGYSGYLFAFYEDGRLIVSSAEQGGILLSGTFEALSEDSFTVRWTLPGSGLPEQQMIWKITSIKTHEITLTINDTKGLTLRHVVEEQPLLQPPADQPPADVQPLPPAELKAHMKIMGGGQSIGESETIYLTLVAGQEGQEFEFDASASTGDISKYEWVVNEEVVSTEKTMRHALKAGQYAVVLRVTSSANKTEEARAAIVVIASAAAAPGNQEPPAQQPVTASEPVVRINEIDNLPGCDGTNTECTDAVELYNTTAQAVDIGGWKIVTAHQNSVAIPAGTMLGAGGYYVAEKSDWLGGQDETLALLDATEASVDEAPWVSDIDSQKSWQLCDAGGASDWDFRAITLGAANLC